jgi:hypothetical protein
VGCGGQQQHARQSMKAQLACVDAGVGALASSIYEYDTDYERQHAASTNDRSLHPVDSALSQSSISVSYMIRCILTGIHRSVSYSRLLVHTAPGFSPPVSQHQLMSPTSTWN